MNMRNILMIGAAALAASPSFAEELEIAVNPQQKFQTIDHFAAADAWSGNFVGKHFPDGCSLKSSGLTEIPKA